MAWQWLGDLTYVACALSHPTAGTMPNTFAFLRNGLIPVVNNLGQPQQTQNLPVLSQRDHILYNHLRIHTGHLAKPRT